MLQTKPPATGDGRKAAVAISQTQNMGLILHPAQCDTLGLAQALFGCIVGRSACLAALVCAIARDSLRV